MKNDMKNDMDTKKIIEQLTAAAADAAEKWVGTFPALVSELVTRLRKADSCAINRLDEAFRPIIEPILNRPGDLEEIEGLLKRLDVLRPDKRHYSFQHWCDNVGHIEDCDCKHLAEYGEVDELSTPQAAIRELIAEGEAKKAAAKTKTLAHWKVEFYPVVASRIAKTGTDLDVINHSIWHWRGALPENRDRYGLVMNGNTLVDKAGDRLTFGTNTCSLCQQCDHACHKCLIYKSLGCTCTDNGSPYLVFRSTGDPKPMLELLYQTWAIVIAEVKRKVEEEKKAEERAQPPQILHNGMVYIHADIANKPE